jgi:hypothetical protein
VAHGVDNFTLPYTNESFTGQIFHEFGKRIHQAAVMVQPPPMLAAHAQSFPGFHPSALARFHRFRAWAEL